MEEYEQMEFPGMEDVDVDLTEEELTQDPDLDYSDEDPNLVVTFSQTDSGLEVLKTIVEECVEAFDEAWSSSEEYRERQAKDWKLFAGHLPKKTFPYEGCANASIPVMTENLLRLGSRLFSEIFGDFTAVMGVVPVGPDDEGIANVLSKHGNWQLREDIPNFYREAERMVYNFLCTGDVVVNSYYDSHRDHNVHETLNADEFVVPYTLVSTMPDYSDVPYRCQILYRYKHQIEQMRGDWENVDEVLNRSTADWEGDPESPILRAMNELQGVEEPSSSSYSSALPYKLIKFEGWCGHLPNTDGDRFIQCIFDYETHLVLKLQIHEETSWKDRAAERQRQAELDEYHEAYERSADARDQLMRKEAEASRVAFEQSATATEQEAAAAIPERPQLVVPIPDPPSWVPQGEPVPRLAAKRGKSPISTYSHGVNIEPGTGAYGLGYGRIQADYTRAINTAFCQFIDAASVANAPPIYTLYDLPKDDAIRPGAVHKLDMLGEDIAKGVFALPIPGANQQLMEAVNVMMGASQATAQAPDVLSGAAGKSGETYRGLASRIEQASKPLSGMGRKFANTVLRQVLLNNARLNYLFLPEEQLKSIANPITRQYERLTIRRDMYDRDYKVEIRADLRFTSEAQKQQEAMELVQMAASMPTLQPNMAMQHAVLNDFFTAKKRPDLAQLLGNPPPPPETFGPPPQGPPGAGGPPPPAMPDAGGSEQ